MYFDEAHKEICICIKKKKKKEIKKSTADC